MLLIPLICKKPPDIEIGAHGQAGPYELVAKAGDAHGVGAGGGQHCFQCTSEPVHHGLILQDQRSRQSNGSFSKAIRKDILMVYLGRDAY